jgi:hypothetical protein
MRAVTPSIRIAAALLMALVATLSQQGIVTGSPQEVLTLEGDVSGVHDPVIIKERGVYSLPSLGQSAREQTTDP